MDTFPRFMAYADACRQRLSPDIASDQAFLARVAELGSSSNLRFSQLAANSLQTGRIDAEEAEELKAIFAQWVAVPIEIRMVALKWLLYLDDMECIDRSLARMFSSNPR